MKRTKRDPRACALGAQRDLIRAAKRELVLRLHRTSWPGGENTEDAAHADFSLLAMNGFAERTDVGAGAARAPQQLRSAQRSLLGVVLGLDAMGRRSRPLRLQRSRPEICHSPSTFRALNLPFQSDL
jgi:hypothetical protein